MSKKIGGEDAPAALNDFYKTSRPVEPFVWPPTLARQEFAEECDINVLMSRFEHTGVPPTINNAEPRYVDFTSMPTDLMTAMNFLNEADAAFMQLPAKVRKEFDNDAAAFVDFAADPENLDQMRAWGLAPPAVLPDAPREAAGPPEGDPAASAPLAPAPAPKAP